MGLDIYTVTKEQHEKDEAFEAKWADYPDKDTEPERHAEWKADWDALPGHDNVPSERFPENINNRRYLRSSYNSGGFNTQVPRMTRDDDHHYYWVFAPVRPDEEEYTTEITDLAAIELCRERAVQIVDALEKIKSEPVYNVMTETATRFGGDKAAVSAEQALVIFDSERAKEKDSMFDSGYSNRDGAFFPDSRSIHMVAAIPGVDVLGQPAMHIIHKEEFHDSYLESAHVLVEFCDELAALVTSDGAAYLNWSG